MENSLAVLTVSIVARCSVLAVDYCARGRGVKRGMSGEEALAKCPLLHLFRVPEKRGKADLTRYRDVCARVIQVLSRYCSCVERASVDEAFLDVSAEVDTMKSIPTSSNLNSTWVAGFEAQSSACSESNDTGVTEDDTSVVECAGDGAVGTDGGCDAREGTRGRNQNLVEEWLSAEGRESELGIARGAVLANDIRQAVLKETGCTCSAGIAHNKVSQYLHVNTSVSPNGEYCLDTLISCCVISPVLSACHIYQALAKLAAGMHKPNQQTIIPTSCVPAVLRETPLSKM